MFHKILVAMENSETGKNVCEEALSLAKATHASLLLLHVLTDEEIGFPDTKKLSDHLESWERFKEQGIQLLSTCADQAKAAGVNAEFTQTSGVSGSTICDLARDWQANLIITGHRGLIGVQELMAGSVSNYVVHHAPCSVLIISGRGNISPKPRKILVALDKSETGKQVFGEALDLAKATAATLHLFHVMSLEDKSSPPLWSLASKDGKKQWEEFEHPGLELLQKFADQAKAAGVNTEYYQTLGSPGRSICEEARRTQSDLIMMGRRGLTGLSELILGSVSNYVIHYAPSSVLIIQGSVKVSSSASEVAATS